jgi:predicted porin
MKIFKLSAVVLALTGSSFAMAQSASSVTVYGVIDEYVGHTDAKGPGSITTLDSGGFMASRFGLRGSEDLGGGTKVNFALENGFAPDTGAFHDSTRLFNRQAWVGLGSGIGEFRFGRQNTPQFYMCGNFDAFGCATYGSLLNNVSGYNPRFDNTLHYISPDFGGVKLQLGAALGEQAKPKKTTGLNAYMFAAEYRGGPIYIGANHTEQNSSDGSVKAKASFLAGSFDYGSGKVYAGFFKGNTPGSAPATNVLGRDYKAWSLSADFRISPAFTVGALYGEANDTTAADKDARQASLIAKYELSKRTLLYSVLTKLDNKNSANFSLGAAAPITRNTPVAGGDVSGFQLGIRHSF